MKVQVIVTAPPYAPYLADVAAHPIVSGLRLNSIMPLKGEPEEAIRRLTEFGKPVWVDLKGRQLRVVGAAIPPYTELQLSHPIRVDTPVDLFLSDGKESMRVLAVNGDRLILEDGPHRLIGPGESVNIVDPSLEIMGTLTNTDRAYLDAIQMLGCKKVMLSYVETPEDIREVQDILPEAEVMLKIESRKGLQYVRRYGDKFGRLMAARGDLFIEVLRPHKVVSALQEIAAADSRAVAASRIFDSLVYHPVPTSADIGDVAFLLSCGYRTFMLGDAICFQRETVLEALNLLEAITGEFM
jgi:pyruvate kinase